MVITQWDPGCLAFSVYLMKNLRPSVFWEVGQDVWTQEGWEVLLHFSAQAALYTQLCLTLSALASSIQSDSSCSRAQDSATCMGLISLSLSFLN